MIGSKGTPVNGGNPWLRICVEPRNTIRDIVSSDPKRNFILLAIIYGIPLALNCIQTFGLSETVPLWALLIGALFVCPFLGMAGIYVTTWLLEMTGRWMGGQGSFMTIRAAVAWSNVPGIATIVMWALLIGLFGGRVFDQAFVQTQFVGYEAGFLFIAMLIDVIVSVWGFVLLLNTLAEVQHFSIWKALLNVLISFAGVVAVIWLVSLAVGG